MSDKDLRARQAEHELQITEEAHGKLRSHLLEQAVKFAKAGEADKANHQLLLVVALDDLRTMVLVPVTDAEYEREAAKRRAETGQPN